jgi:cob(I)alamin adenosyltransferase
VKPETREALLKAYAQLHQIIEDLYSASQKALENNDLEDASLLESRADRLYEETENLEFVLSELEER